jgi:hypothetical protein
MLYKKKHTENYIKIGIFIFILILNFIFLDKVTSNDKSKQIFQKNIRR